MTIRPSQLHHVSRQTQKLEETRKFYCEVLGFKELSRPGFNFPGAWLYGSGIQIHLIQEPFAPNPVEISSRENHIAFKVDDMDHAAKVLQHHGIAFRHNVVPDRGTNQIFFRDPEGWMVELGPYPAAIDQ